MSSALDKTLEDVISSRSKNRRRALRRNSAKATLVGSATSTTAKVATRARKAASAAQSKTQKQIQPQTPVVHSQKIIVSNLPHDVNEAQIQELFAQSIGPTKQVTLHYDHSGRSTGVAVVVFNRSGDSTRAFQEYHGRLIDGKRLLKVEIVLDPSKPPQPSLSQRVGPAPAASQAAPAASATSRGKKGVKSRGKKKGTKRPNMSAADLDADMADYTGATAAVVA